MNRSFLHCRWLKVSIAVLGVSVSTGCVHYHPKPLDPARNLAVLESRSADDPKLKLFLETNGIKISSPPKWDLHALTLLAFYFHPDLDDARAAAAVSRGAVITAGQRPNPQISPSLTLDTTTSPAWIPSFGLLIPIETAGKRGHRLAQARNLERAAQLRVVRVAWNVRSRVRRTLIDYIAARRAEEVLARELAIQDQIVELLVRQLDAGAVTPFEVTQSRLAAANTRLAANQAALQRSSATAALAEALGLSSQSFEPMAPTVEAGDFSGVQVPGENARRQALVSRTDVLAALSDYEASQASLQLEIARQYPDLQLGPGYMLDQTDNKWTLIGLNVTLPIFNRNQGPIAEATARREQAAAQLLSVQATALRQVSEAVGTVGAARRKLATAKSLVANARQQEQRARARYELGDVSRQELLMAQLEVVADEVSLSDAQLQADQAAGTLEDAIQSPLGFEDIVMKNPRP